MSTGSCCVAERPARVLHLRSSGGYYGAEAVIETLARAQALDGIEVTVACLRDRRSPHTELLDRLLGTRVATRRIESRGRVDPWVPFRIAGVARRQSVDLLHVHDYKTILLGLPAAKALGIPWVTTFHGEVADDRAVSAYERAARQALRFCDGIAVVSRPQQDQLRADGLASQFLPNAVDISGVQREVQACRSGNATLRRSLGIPKSALVIGTVGRLCPDKGQMDAFAATEAAMGARTDVHWILAGEGEDRDRLRGRVAASGVRDRIHLAGYVESRGALYGALDVLLHPSHREGLSMVVLEAMAAGLAVVATPVGEVGALIEQGRGLALADRGPAIASALDSVLDDAQVRQDLGQRALSHVQQQHSAPAMSQKYLHELYLPALAGLSP